MNRLGRWLLFGLGRDISREQALEIAEEACQTRNLPWREPVKVFRHYGDWAVWTFADHRGGNIRVIVDGGSGEIIRVSGPTPR